MLSKMFRTSVVIFAFLVLGCTTWAQSIEIGAVNPVTHTLTITVKGTIGPMATLVPSASRSENPSGVTQVLR